MAGFKATLPNTPSADTPGPTSAGIRYRKAHRSVRLAAQATNNAIDSVV